MTLILDACCFPYITYTMCGLWIRPLLMFECLCCPSHFPVADSAFISIPVFALPRIIVVYVFPLVTSAIIFQSRRGTIFLPLSPCFPILLTPPPHFFHRRNACYYSSGPPHGQYPGALLFCHSLQYQQVAILKILYPFQDGWP